MKPVIRPVLLLLFILLTLSGDCSNLGWTQVADCGGVARHRAVAISIGSRGYTGMGHINAVTDILYDDWWEYDPGTNSWCQKANFPGGARMHSSAFSIGNKGYVGFGRDDNNITHNDLFEYDPVSNSWTQMASMPGPTRRGAVAFSIGTKGYICSGSNGTRHKDLWEYNSQTNSWTQRPDLPGVRRISAAGFSIGNKGYVGTGDNGAPLSDFYEYDPATNSWATKASVPPVPRMEACGFALNGKGYIGTGCDQQSGNNYQDFWCYDPALDSWSPAQEFAGAARRYMSSFTIGYRAYTLFGTSGINYKDCWQFGNLTGMEEEASGFGCRLFPQPLVTSSTLIISGSATLTFTLFLFDVNGKKIAALPGIANSPLILERNGLAPGTYFYKAVFENETSMLNGKLLIE